MWVDMLLNKKHQPNQIKHYLIPKVLEMASVDIATFLKPLQNTVTQMVQISNRKNINSFGLL